MNKQNNIEIELELTYLACEIPKEIAGLKGMKMFDAYIPETSKMPFLRLRQKGDEFELTKKKPISETDFSQHTEQTIPLEKDEFDALSITSQRTVTKRRYNVSIEGHNAEVDIFDGPLDGLVLIDFEFESLAAKQKFDPPKCCLVEVTQELFIAGGQLAGKTYQDIESDLDRFNYMALSQ